MSAFPGVSSDRMNEGSHLSASESLPRTDVAQRLRNVERLGRWLDQSIRVPGTEFKIGWDTLIGLFPGVGDAVTTVMSAWIIREAHMLGVSRWTLLRMAGNTALDSLVGAVPGVGDIFDAFYKSNMRNLRLLQKHLESQSIVLKVPEEKPVDGFSGRESQDIR